MLFRACAKLRQSSHRLNSGRPRAGQCRGLRAQVMLALFVSTIVPSWALGRVCAARLTGRVVRLMCRGRRRLGKVPGGGGTESQRGTKDSPWADRSHRQACLVIMDAKCQMQRSVVIIVSALRAVLAWNILEEPRSECGSVDGRGRWWCWVMSDPKYAVPRKTGGIGKWWQSGIPHR